MNGACRYCLDVDDLDDKGLCFHCSSRQSHSVNDLVDGEVWSVVIFIFLAFMLYLLFNFPGAR